MSGFKVLVGQTDDGRWAAWSLESPYFRFEGDTQEAAASLVERAYEFYLSNPPSERADALRDIVVTSEMIEAGMRAYDDRWIGLRDGKPGAPEEMLAEAYRAMRWDAPMV
jgi:hypothetical protein